MGKHNCSGCMEEKEAKAALDAHNKANRKKIHMEQCPRCDKWRLGKIEPNGRGK